MLVHKQVSPSRSLAFTKRLFCLHYDDTIPIGTPGYREEAGPPPYDRAGISTTISAPIPYTNPNKKARGTGQVLYLSIYIPGVVSSLYCSALLLPFMYKRRFRLIN